MYGGYGTNFRAPKVDVHDFSMVPRADIPRSGFRMQHQHKTTFDASKLIPIYVQEVLPGDSFNVSVNAFVRMATPLYPIMDNMQLESFFFFVPCRLVWNHWKFFQGEQNSPADSISYAVPTCASPANGFAVNSIYDYMGLPTVGQVAAGGVVTVNAMPLRSYNLIVQEWFRDENLQNALGTGSTSSLPAGAQFLCQSDDGPDSYNNYSLFTVGKRHDYFTSCLPWTQKSATPVSIPFVGNATVKTNASDLFTGTQTPMFMNRSDTGAKPGNFVMTTQSTVSGAMGYNATAGGAATAGLYPSNLYADLSTAAAVTINALRLAFQTQRLLERDARGGTRYTEIVRSHFGVVSPDARLMRPEYLGGGKTPINIAPVPQTTATGLTGGTSPLGTLSAVGLATGRHGFRQSFTEHGYILGLVTVRNDKVYQQGLRKLWSRSTRYDFYMPVFAALGEQPVLNQEIYCQGQGALNDTLTFGYQERWAEYRYMRSYTSGFFRSTSPTPLDAWHLAQKFTALPALNATFIQDDLNVTLQRSLAAGASSANQQFLADFFFDEKVARAMPTYSVPGLVDHF